MKLGGYKPDPDSDKYWKYNSNIFKNAKPVYSGDIDLRQFCSPIVNQRRTGTCVAQSVISALELKRIQKYGHDKHVDLSVLDLYYGCRDLMDPKQTNIDEGTYISLACDVLRRWGVCREKMHPFEESKLFIPPPVLATREAYLNKITACYKIFDTGWDRVDVVKANLIMGNPVCFGTRVDNKWMDSNDKTPLGPVSWESSKGLHATCIVGYVNNLFVIQNSWGKNWKDDGFGYVRPEVIASPEASDFWIILDNSDMWTEDKK